MLCAIEEHREAEPLTQLGEQVEHGGLHRDVECRDRLVGDQDLGLERERAGDRDALALAARELAREGVERARRQARRGRAARGSARRCGRAGTSSCTRNSSASACCTVMRGLSDEYGSWKTICTRRRSAARALGGATWPPTSDLARGRLVEADDAAAERGLAAARLADEAERLAARDREVDAIDGAQHVDRGLAQAARERVVAAGSASTGRGPRAAAQPPGITARGARRRPPRGGCRRWRGLAERDAAGIDGRAVGLGERAARVETAAGRRRHEVGRRAGDRLRGVARRSSKSGTERSSAERVRMARLAEHLGHGARLDDAAGVHHGDALARLGDTARSCVTKTIAHAELAGAVRASRCRIWSWIVTSSAVVGSSQRSNCGSLASAIAIRMRWRSPPESSCG